jgi:hypothetical protein
MTGRVVYDRRIHTFTIKDVIRILKTLNFEFHDILKVQEMLQDLWAAFKRWLMGLLDWVREKAGPWLVKWIIKFFVLEILYIFRYGNQWPKESEEIIDGWITWIKKW